MSEKKYKMKQFFSKVTYLVLLDKINYIVFWTVATSLVMNQVLDSYYIFVEENTKPRKKSILIRNFYNKVQGILTTVHLWEQGILSKAIPEHRAFLVKPSMEPGLS